MKDSSPRAASYFSKILRNGVFVPAYLVGAFALGVTLVYAQWFKATLKFPLSTDPAGWGQFGDFIGGVLNPVCAYMAFVWLVRSYALQRLSSPKLELPWQRLRRHNESRLKLR